MMPSSEPFEPGRSRWERGRNWLCGIHVAVVVATMIGGSGLAQPVPGSIEVGVGEGRFFGGSFQRGSNDLFDHRVEADDDILRGLWLGAQLSRRWSLEVAVRRTETHLVEPASGVFPRKPTLATFIPTTVDLSGLWSFSHGNFAPYIGFGAGFMNVEADTEDAALRDVNRFSLSMALGARFYAARWIGARIDVRGRATYLGARSLGEDRGAFDRGRWFHSADLLGGAFLSFGGKPSP
jgi:hypothetical protein